MHTRTSSNFSNKRAHDNKQLAPQQSSVTAIPNNQESSLGWYWWFRGKFLSDVPDDFLPTSNDVLEQLAWASIKYDHLGGPNTQNVLLTHVKPGQITNPNNAWDMSKNVAPINKRVFQYQNFLHYITILLHLLVLLPLSSTLLMTNGSRKRWIQFILDRFKKRPL